MINRITIIVTFCFLVLWFPAISQTDTIRTKDIEIVKDYTPYIEEGKKQRFQPVLPTIEATNRENLTYTIPQEFMETQYQPDELQPLPLRPTNTTEVKNVYVKGGYGNKNNPLIQFALNGAETNNFTVGALANYQAVKGGFNDQKMKEASGKIFATKELTNASLDGSLHYNYISEWLYGYDHDDPNINIIEFDSKNAYHSIAANFGLQSASLDEYALQYDVDMQVETMNEELNDIKENQLRVGTRLQKLIFDDLNATLSADVTTRKTKNPNHSIISWNDYNETVFHATPTLSTTFSNQLHLQAGASLNYDKEHEFKIFPNLSIELPLSDKQFILYAGWKGRTFMNGFQQLIKDNSRLSTETIVKNYTKEVRTPIGLKGSLNDALSFNASVSQEVSKNKALFINDNIGLIIPDRTFQPTYESTLTNWKPAVNVNYQFGDDVNALASIDYNIYSTKSEAEAWHLPKFDAAVNVNVSPVENLSVGLGLNALSGISFRELDGTANTLDPLLHLNLRGQYQLNNEFSIFLDANNLTNNTNERWKNYSLIGTNVLAGIVFSY